ncbi:quinoprotein dehydrogenase-associated SoxYZ-like carrier [Vogesella sp. LIG4]|uniref:quinoprotein dehydrogenase-associated SoxYZ-like carrier n=1 Tax=Vogesella sp. LIG4 TaxID=1192162 RepID=UPI00081F7F66|nr:quinoprotein dehydrogenase-associated SoxYZ-like carrier [Vogesella sp. LIG4]SCK05256.1 sulfur-oxidizing protein SoxY [Vogesella sp. LIG4]
MLRLLPALLCLLPACVLAASQAANQHNDPLHSVMWDVMQHTVLQDQPTVFDSRVVVSLPRQVEDGQRVPVSVDASALGQVEELLLFADYNPLPLALRFRIGSLRPTLAVAMRVNQATPVRAAARTADGVWHVGGQLVDAPGGGCALPTPTRNSTDWATLQGRLYGKLWPQDGRLRARLRIMHPMDTGLVGNTPRFHLNTLQLADGNGAPLASLTLEPPLAESPLFTFELPADTPGPLRINAGDSDGNRYQALLRSLP